MIVLPWPGNYHFRHRDRAAGAIRVSASALVQPSDERQASAMSAEIEKGQCRAGPSTGPRDSAPLATGFVVTMNTAKHLLFERPSFWSGMEELPWTRGSSASAASSIDEHRRSAVVYLWWSSRMCGKEEQGWLLAAIADCEMIPNLTVDAQFAVAL
jgi:hypothetical protein